MSMETFQACLKGYTDRMFDQQVIGLQNGYWAGYYSNPNVKKPKPLKTMLKILMRGKEKVTQKQAHVPNVDVDAFLQAEKAFREKAAKYAPVKKVMK